MNRWEWVSEFRKHAEETNDAERLRLARLSPPACSDARLLPVHLGVADYIPWWHRLKTGDPPDG